MIWGFSGIVVALLGAYSLNLRWITDLVEIALFLLAAIAASSQRGSLKPVQMTQVLLAFSIPCLGVLQILFGAAAYKYATLTAVMDWACLPAGIILGLIFFKPQPVKESLLRSMWVVAAAIIILELYQIFVLGRYMVLASGYPLMSSNLYVEMAELLLPIVFALALRKEGNLWLGCILAALLMGTAVASGARAGSILLFVEAASVALITRSRSGYRTISLNRQGLAVLALFLFTIALEGSGDLQHRLGEGHPFAGRGAVLHSTFDMFEARPIFGFGLGCFPVVYPGFARFESPYKINHAHNDYLEIATEGGSIMLFLWLGILVCAIPNVVKSPWTIGPVAIVVHSLTDFPLHRIPVVLLSGLLMSV